MNVYWFAYSVDVFFIGVVDCYYYMFIVIIIMFLLCLFVFVKDLFKTSSADNAVN